MTLIQHTGMHAVRFTGQACRPGYTGTGMDVVAFYDVSCGLDFARPYRSHCIIEIRVRES